jgi:hypothetical protein
MFYHGIVKNSEALVPNSLRFATLPLPNPLIFHNPGATRAFGDSPEGRINGGFAAVWRASPAAKRAEREEFSLLNLSRD